MLSLVYETRLQCEAARLSRRDKDSYISEEGYKYLLQTIRDDAVASAERYLKNMELLTKEEDGIIHLNKRYNALRMAAHDDYMEFVTFLMSHGAYVGFQRKDTPKSEKHQPCLHLPRSVLDDLLEHCAREGVDDAKAQAKAYCYVLIATSFKVFQLDKAISKPAIVDIYPEHDGVSVRCDQSE